MMRFIIRRSCFPDVKILPERWRGGVVREFWGYRLYCIFSFISDTAENATEGEIKAIVYGYVMCM